MSFLPEKKLIIKTDMPIISCPNCKKILTYKSIKDLPDFPFCSNRCKLIDLGAWLDESYRIEEPLNTEMPDHTEKEGENDGGSK